MEQDGSSTKCLCNHYAQADRETKRVMEILAEKPARTMTVLPQK
jgi:hypothetical protein